MNNNIKDTTSLVFVRGKNLFNKNAVLKNYELTNNGANVGYNVLWFVSDYIEVEPNTIYYLSGDKTGGTTNAFYDENKTFISYVSKTTGDITTPSNAKYIRFNGKLSEIDNNIMLEQNSTATTYQEYVEKQIQIKNKNGVFEEFYSENELNQDKYSLGERKIGTWINGKPLYRKVLDFGALPNNGSKDMSYDDTYNIVYINGYAWQNSYGTPIPNSHQNDNNAINLFVQNLQHKVTIETYMDRSSYTNCFIWIYYTKTTD